MRNQFHSFLFQSSSPSDSSSSPPPVPRLSLILLHLPVRPHPPFIWFTLLHSPLLPPGAYCLSCSCFHASLPLPPLPSPHLNRTIVSFPSGPVYHGVADGLNGTFPFLLLTLWSLSFIPSPSRSHLLYLSISPSVTYYSWIWFREREREGKKRIKMHLQLEEDPFASVHVCVATALGSVKNCTE